MRVTAIIILVLSLIVASCRQRTPGAAVTEEEEKTTAFNPLETPADREIVPELYASAATTSKGADSTTQKGGKQAAAVSTDQPTEVFRVQLYMSRLYNEANRERALADEIFSLPVYLDYEVPYYKLRVGDFATREEAEGMIPAIQGLGYSEAWVARVIQKIKELPQDSTSDMPILNPPLTPDQSRPSKAGEKR